MKTNQIKAEVYNMEGLKVHICRDINNMDLSKLANDVYFISYQDALGNVLWTERFVKEAEKVHEYVYIHK
jgi:hypothetical protein